MGNSQIRTQGIISQTYYTAGMGKSVFTQLPNSNIRLMNGAIGLPVGEWMERGVPIGELIRVILMEPDNCSGPIGIIGE